MKTKIVPNAQTIPLINGNKNKNDSPNEKEM